MSTEGKSRRFYLVNLGWVIMISALLSACGEGAQSPTEVLPPSTQPVVQVIPDNQSEKQLIPIVTVSQNNCEGGGPVKYTISQSYIVSHTVSLGDSVSVNASGEAGIPGVGKVQVGTVIAANYNTTYGQQDSITRTYDVSTNPGLNVNYEVQPFEIWQTGKIVITDGSKEVGQYPYKFRTDFGIDLIGSKALGCPTSTPTATPLPTFTPTSTATALVDAYSGTWIYPYTANGTVSFALYRLIISQVNSQNGTAIVSVCQCLDTTCKNKRKLNPEDASATFNGTKLVTEPVYFLDVNGNKAQWTLEAVRIGDYLKVSVQQDNGNIPQDFGLDYVKPRIGGNITVLDECQPPPEFLP